MGENFLNTIDQLLVATVLGQFLELLCQFISDNLNILSVLLSLLDSIIFDLSSKLLAAVIQALLNGNLWSRRWELAKSPKYSEYCRARIHLAEQPFS